jgi:hypothetical protein
LYLDGLPENFLKLVSVEGFSGTHSSLTKIIKTDVLFQATVLKSFPEQNKAIIGIANKKIMVETQQPLKPGEVLLLRGDKTTSVPKLKIITDAKSINLNLLKIQDKTQMSSVNNYDNYSQKNSITPNARENSNSVHTRVENQAIVPDDLEVSIENNTLILGQKIKASVVDISSKNIAIVKYRDKFLTAHFVDKPPKIGTVIKFIVTQHEEKFRLVAQESISSNIVKASDIKDLLPFKEPFGKMIKNLKSLIDSPAFETFIKSDSLLIKRLVKTLNLLSPHIQPDGSPQLQKTFNGKILKEQIDYSGINYESKVKHIFEGKVPFQMPSKLNMDLKYQLLDLLNTMEPSTQKCGNNFEQRRPLIDIIKKLSHAVDNIELHQLANQLARQENQPIVIQVPDPINFGKTIKVYIKPAEDSKENSKQKKEGVLLVFFLNMSALGNLRVDAQVFQESVSIKIKVENITVAKFIDSKLAEFSFSLKDLGSKVHATCCVIPVIKDDIASELNQLLIDDDERLVDLTT